MAIDRKWMIPLQGKDDLQRFESKFQRTSEGCWDWRGTPCNGYGQFVVGGRRHGIADYAHRWAWLFYHGALPHGCEVHHRCENKKCVNPDHLEALPVSTHRRLHVKGFLSVQAMRNREKTHCKHGHSFDTANTYIYPNGERACRACQRAAQARYYRERQEQP